MADQGNQGDGRWARSRDATKSKAKGTKETLVDYKDSAKSKGGFLKRLFLNALGRIDAQRQRKETERLEREQAEMARAESAEMFFKRAIMAVENTLVYGQINEYQEALKEFINDYYQENVLSLPDNAEKIGLIVGIVDSKVKNLVRERLANNAVEARYDNIITDRISRLEQEEVRQLLIEAVGLESVESLRNLLDSIENAPAAEEQAEQEAQQAAEQDVQEIMQEFMGNDEPVREGPAAVAAAGVGAPVRQDLEAMQEAEALLGDILGVNNLQH